MKKANITLTEEEDEILYDLAIANSRNSNSRAWELALMGVLASRGHLASSVVSYGVSSTRNWVVTYIPYQP